MDEEVERKPDILMLQLSRDLEEVEPEEEEEVDFTDPSIHQKIYEKLTAAQRYNQSLASRLVRLERRQETVLRDLKNQMRILGEAQKINIGAMEKMKTQMTEFGETQRKEFQGLKEEVAKIGKETSRDSGDVDTQNSQVLHCIFCDANSHDSDDCDVVSNWLDRRCKANSKKLCHKCLGPAHPLDEQCPRGSTDCPNCSDRFVGEKTILTRHHPTLCFFRTPRERKSKAGNRFSPY